MLKNLKKEKQQINPADKVLLKQLTTNALFCANCFKPFLKTPEEKVTQELVTPFIALLDLLSAICFVIIPIAWIPLIIVFALIALKDLLFDLIIGSNNDDDEYRCRDFDREYFPHQFDRAEHCK